jgi:uncharacterized membrane protein
MDVELAERNLPVAPPEPGGHPLEIWISYVLRIGVLTAATVTLFGLILYFIKGPDPGRPTTLHELTAGGGQRIDISWRSILDGLGSLEPSSVILLGLLILILTPLTRVAMTFVLFLKQQDWIFVAITGVVLGILVIGLIGVGS